MTVNMEVELMNAVRAVENIIKRSKQADGAARTGYGRIMSAVIKENGAPQAKLAELLAIRPQSLTRALSELETLGYIERKRDDADRRIINVYITEEGVRHHSKMKKRREERAENVFGKLAEEDKQQLLTLLKEVIQNNCEKEGSR